MTTNCSYNLKITLNPLFMPLVSLAVPSIIISGVSIFWLLIFNPRGVKRINQLLALLLLILLYNQFVNFGYNITGLKEISLYLTYSDAMIFYLSMPLFYILIMHITEKREILYPGNHKHFWPAIPGLVFTVYFGIMPLNQKELVRDGDHCGVLPDAIIYIAGITSIVFYIILTIRKLIIFYRKNQGVLEAGSKKQIVLYIWFLYGVAFLSLGFCLLLTMIREAAQIHLLINSFLNLLTVAYLVLIFYIRPDYIKMTRVSHAKKVQKKKQGRSNDENLLMKIEKLMDEKEVFRDPALNLAKISKLAGNHSSYKVSNVIKEKYNCSFSEYVNKKRIAHAIRMLEEAGNNIPKIEFMAYDCGFASRSTFYSNFTKLTGKTPLEYREGLRQ